MVKNGRNLLHLAFDYDSAELIDFNGKNYNQIKRNKNFAFNFTKCVLFIKIYFAYFFFCFVFIMFQV